MSFAQNRVTPIWDKTLFDFLLRVLSDLRGESFPFQTRVWAGGFIPHTGNSGDPDSDPHPTHSSSSNEVLFFMRSHCYRFRSLSKARDAPTTTSILHKRITTRRDWNRRGSGSELRRNISGWGKMLTPRISANYSRGIIREQEDPWFIMLAPPNDVLDGT